MIFLIVAVNLSITLLNIYIAIKIWQLRLLIARINNILVNYESYFRLVFQIAPQVIIQGQSNTHLLRQRYQLLQVKTAKIRQLIWLFNWSYRLWLRKS